MSLHCKLLILLLCAGSIIPATAQTPVTPSLGNLTENQKIQGFTAQAVYLNEAGQPMGARFLHDRTGFTFDLLQIESVPQTFIWVNTLPVSDKGEPHTQEHLLITKGNKGHELNTREGMSLAVSNAFTSQVFTAYHFNTNAGSDVFYKLFEEYMDALLHPDYTDEEVHREVRNWGVAEDAATKKLRLEEKGSVYNEMKTSMNNPYSQVFNRIQRMMYGEAHPLSFNSGGLPPDIRILNETDIKKFHDNNYHLNNMGAIAALPKNMAPSAVLSTMNNILNRLQPGHNDKTVDNSMPAAQPVAVEKTAIVEYPSANQQEPGVMMFAYPAALTTDALDDLTLTVFLNTFAGDASTNLYKKFIDGTTREMDLGAQGVFAYEDNHMGHPVFIGFDGVNTANLTKEAANIVWQKVQDELKKIAAFKEGSKDLNEFNARFKNNLIDYQRSLSKFINTPPLFGGRNTGDFWYQQLEEMKKITSFKKSITMVPQFKEIDALLASGKNFWGNYFEKWKLLNDHPFTVLAKANNHLLQQQDSTAKLRAADEVAVLQKKYNLQDEQEIIKKYKEDYDANTLELEKAEQAHTAKFIDNPPLTLDDQLDFTVKWRPNKIPLVTSTFNNMSGASFGLALKLDKLPQNKLVYLAMFPDLLTQSGLFKDGKATSFEDMSQLQRLQILSISSYYSINIRTKRTELIIKADGNNSRESARAVDWVNDLLRYPYLRTENLPRLRDLVNQTLGALRKTMQASEESWVNDAGTAWRAQDNLLALSTSSFLTRTHNVQRLRWMLMDAGNNAARALAVQFLADLSAAKGTREEFKRLLLMLSSDKDSLTKITQTNPAMLADNYAKLDSTAKKIIREAAIDLEQTINDLPEASLAGDWQYLCMEMKRDLSQTPEKTLADLEEVRKNILHAGNARMFLIGSKTVQASLEKNMKILESSLATGEQAVIQYPLTKNIEMRYQQRTGTKDSIVFAGLINQNSATGVFMNWASLVTYKDTSRDKLLHMLAAELHAGGGKQSVYTKTTGAGLSYSTGVRVSPASGLFTYYAERTPLLPQTLSFVIDEIKKTPADKAMSEYVIAMALSANRASGQYESRGESMAEDLADGQTPETVRNFRKALLRLRKYPQLMNEVYKRKDAVYETILPGYGIKMKNVKGGTYFVIGAEKQMAAYESYLQSKEGANTKLVRLYPRDFWITYQ